MTIEELQKQVEELKSKISELEGKNNINKRIEDVEKRLYFDEKVNEVLTSAPTYIPKNFREQFTIYETGGERRLYVFINGSWYYEILT